MTNATSRGTATKPVAASNMYADAKTWNPFKGCLFDCTYCEPSFKKQAKRQKQRCMDCYNYKPHSHPEILATIPSSKIVFLCGNGDISFCDHAFVEQIIERIKSHKPRREKVFYLQSKRPKYFETHLSNLPQNVILVTTLETNRDEGYGEFSQAPSPSERYKQFLDLDYPRKVVTIEPLMEFDIQPFTRWMKEIDPEYIWTGFNSKPKSVALPEPSEEKTQRLIDALVEAGMTVRGKETRGIVLPKS